GAQVLVTSSWSLCPMISRMERMPSRPVTRSLANLKPPRGPSKDPARTDESVGPALALSISVRNWGRGSCRGVEAAFALGRWFPVEMPGLLRSSMNMSALGDLSHPGDQKIVIPYEWVNGRGEPVLAGWVLESRQQRQLRALLIQLEGVDYEMAVGTLIFKKGASNIYYSKVN